MGTTKSGDDAATWRGSSAEQRLDDRRQRLIEACRTLVGGEGEAALSVRALCRAAGVGPRHFYEAFTDPDALLVVTYLDVVADMTAAVTSAVRTADRSGQVDGRLRAALAAAADYCEANTDGARLIFGVAVSSRVLRVHANAALGGFVDRMMHVVAGQSDTGSPVRSSMLAGGLAMVFVNWLSGDLAESRDRVVGECAALCAALMAVDVSAESEADG